MPDIMCMAVYSTCSLCRYTMGFEMVRMSFQVSASQQQGISVRPEADALHPLSSGISSGAFEAFLR